MPQTAELIRKSSWGGGKCKPGLDGGCCAGSHSEIKTRRMHEEGGGRWQKGISWITVICKVPTSREIGIVRYVWVSHGRWMWRDGDGCDCGRWGRPHIPSPAELRNEALRKGKNTFKPVNETDQRAGIVAACAFSQREEQVTWKHNLLN